MQVSARASTRVSARRSVAVAPVRSSLRVVCKAQSSVSEVAKKVVLASSTLPAMLVAHPAFALVDERLNGDGTGLPFGINDSALGWAVGLMFTTIWAVYFTSQRDLGDFEDPDAGLKIDQ